jgi:hypothetical protein
MTEVKLKAIEDKPTLTQLLIRAAGALGGGAVVFYVLGFTVVQTYVYKNELGGMFWFTNAFYGDAGAKFLLEMIRAPLLAFYVLKFRTCFECYNWT